MSYFRLGGSCLVGMLVLLSVPMASYADNLVNLTAYHYSGQTYITWDEIDRQATDRYEVYRSSSAITLDSGVVKSNGSPISPFYIEVEGSSSVPYGRQYEPTKFNSGVDFDEFELTHYPVMSTGEQVTMLDDSQGFLVWTPAATAQWTGDNSEVEDEQAYYAVLVEGETDADYFSATGAITETNARVKPVLAWERVNESDEVRNRLYIEYMSLDGWNAKGMGYGIPYIVSYPVDFDPEESDTYPVQLQLHHKDFQGQPIDRTDSGNYILIQAHDRYSTFYFGWHESFDYSNSFHHYISSGVGENYALAGGTLPSNQNGKVVNYTEMSLLRMVQDTLDDSFNHADSNYVYATGFSMGASGALALGIRYPQVFSTIYSLKPMTNFSRQPQGLDEEDEAVVDFVNGRAIIGLEDLSEQEILDPVDGVTTLYGPLNSPGSQSVETAVEIRSPWLGVYNDDSTLELASHLEWINNLDISVWEWLDLGHVMNTLLRDQDTAYIQFVSGLKDEVLLWSTQGQPFFNQINNAHVGYTGAATCEVHAVSAPSVPYSLMMTNGSSSPVVFWDDFKYPKNLSYPALSYPDFAFQTPPIAVDVECSTSTLSWNLNVVWNVDWWTGTQLGISNYDAQGSITDTSTTWSVALWAYDTEVISETNGAYVDVTPKRTQAFHPIQGKEVNWEVETLDTTPVTLASGTICVDNTNGTVTVPRVPLTTSGVRVTLTTTTTNCNQRPDFTVLCLSEYGDIWGIIPDNEDEDFPTSPTMWGDAVGYKHDQSIGWQTVSGDFTGDGLGEFACITQYGDVWTVENDGERTLDNNTNQSSGWAYDEEDGWGVVVADVDGDGHDDLVQFTEYTDYVWISLADTDGSFDSPSQTNHPGTSYLPADGFWIGAGDVNGDGRDDLVQIDDSGDAYVALAQSNGTYADLEDWSPTQSIIYDRTNEYGVHLGDVNGDGYADLISVPPYDLDPQVGVLVALSNGKDGFYDVDDWGYLAFRDAPGNDEDGYNVFVTDINRDGRADLLCLTSNHNIWVARSTAQTADREDAFGTPVNYGETGFKHHPLGAWQTFTGRY